VVLRGAFDKTWLHYCKARFDWQTRLLAHPLLMCLANHPGPDGIKPIDQWLAQKHVQQQRLLLPLDNIIFQEEDYQKQPVVIVERGYDRQKVGHFLSPSAIQQLIDQNYLTVEGDLRFSGKQIAQEKERPLLTAITVSAVNKNADFTAYLNVYPEVCPLELAKIEFSLLLLRSNLSWIESAHMTVENKFYPILLLQGIEEALLGEMRASPKEFFEAFLMALENKKADNLQLGSLLVEKLELRDETLTGAKLLALTKNIVLSYLHLEKTQVKLEDLKTLLSFSGCTGVEICLGENQYLGLADWQYLLHSPLCHHFSLRLTNGEVFCLKGSTTTDSKILPSDYLIYLHKISKARKLATSNHLQLIETFLVHTGYPSISFEACVEKQTDQKLEDKVILSVHYLIQMLEEKAVDPEQYLTYYLKLNKPGRQNFYEQACQKISTKDKERCQRIQNVIGDYPDSDGDRRLSTEKEEKFRQQLKKLVEKKPRILPLHERVLIAGLTPEKTSLSKKLVKKLINDGWLVNENFNFERKKKQNATNADKGSSNVVHGNHLVIPINYHGSKLHCKVSPDFPGMEVAYRLLSQRIMGRGSPQVELWKWTYGQHIYPMLMSETIVGENLTPKLLGNFPLELFSYQQHVLMAMLVNPGDGNPGNFIAQKIQASDGATQLRLVSIDNDRLFAPPFEIGKLRTSTIVYCFNEMQLALHKDLRNQFLSLNAYEVLYEWLNSLEKLNQHYCEIFTSKELAQFMSGIGEVSQGSYLLTILKRQTVAELFRKIKILQHWLSMNPQMSLINLLSKVHPSLANHYQLIQTQYDNPIQRFEGAMKNEYRREEEQGVIRYTSTMRMEQYLKMQGREITQDKTVTSYWQQDFTQAKKELRDLSISRGVIELAKLQLLQGKLKSFEELPEAYGQEEVLASIHFNQTIRDSKGLPDPQRQQAIIAQIINSPGLKPLERLIITHCALTDKQLKQLLQRLPNLKILKLIHCPLIKESFHETLFDSDKLPKQLQTCILEDMTGVEEVRLTSHSVQYLAIKRAQNLKTFYVYSDSLTQLNLSQKSEETSSLVTQCHQFDIYAKALQEADFSGNLLLTDQHLQAIVLNCQNLKQMNLQDCDEQKIHYRALKEVLPAFAERVAKNEEEVEFLRSASGWLSEIVSNRTKSLWISRQKNVAGWLWKCCCAALAENISVKDIHIEISESNDEDLTSLAKAIEKNQAVESIVFDVSSSMGDKGADALANAIKFNKTLRKITIPFMKLSSQSAINLVNSLKYNQTLREIGIFCPNIEDECVIALAHVLERNDTLRKVSLDSNNLSDESAIALADVLKYNHTLKEIRLGINVGNKGAVALAKALKCNGTLKKISFGNNINDKGVVNFAEQFKHNHSVENIDLRGNAISDEGILALNNLLKENNHITKITINADKASPLVQPLLDKRLHVEVTQAIEKILKFVVTPGVISMVNFLDSMQYRNFSYNSIYCSKNFQINPLTFFSEYADCEDLKYNNSTMENAIGNSQNLELNQADAFKQLFFPTTQTGQEARLKLFGFFSTKDIRSFGCTSKACYAAQQAVCSNYELNKI
jgi:hypothetical protein